LFNFINRDHLYGLAIGAALIGVVFFFAGCKTDKDVDTADTAEETTTVEATPVLTETGSTIGDTGVTDTGTDTGTTGI
jgi:hypothetical protein